MVNRPVVSIVLIFFNEERFLSEAIESVLAQDFHEWELLLVDDGSGDRSSQIARRYVEAFPRRMRLLQHPHHRNCGMSASRNLGIAEAQGSYIALLDADDAWMPYTLHEQVAIMEAHPDVAMVYGPLLWWYSWTGDPEAQGRDFVQNVGVEPDTIVFPPKLVMLFLQNEHTAPSGILVRHSALAKIGLFEERFAGLYEDQVFRVKVCLKAPVYVAGRVWYKWRKHPASCCSVAVKQGGYHSAREEFLNWVDDCFSREGVRDPLLRKILREIRWRYRHPLLFRLIGWMNRSRASAAEFMMALGRRVLPRFFRRWLRHCLRSQITWGS
jgi:glycosyltransferase involved in cell wall biosynthesis